MRGNPVSKVKLPSEHPVTSLKGVGPALATKLERLGISSVQDLLFHLPFRYEDHTTLSPIGSISSEGDYVIEGQVLSCDIQFGRRRSLVVQLQDDTGRLSLRFFHFNRSQVDQFNTHPSLRCYGRIRRGPRGLEMVHPQYQRSPKAPLPDSLTPVYSVVDGLSQIKLRGLIKQALMQPNLDQAFSPLIGDPNSLSVIAALRLLHQPHKNEDLNAIQAGTHPAQRSLILEELSAYQLGMMLWHQETQSETSSPLPLTEHLLNRFKDLLPFSLTGAQTRVIEEILSDLDSTSPTLRLIQGDVGAGKTVVAAVAALAALANNQQVALMAPTELLAEQHHRTLSAWFEALDFRVGWLSGSVKGKARDQLLEALALGEIDLLIGTHALFQSHVLFKTLGLVLIDEQHRFGVAQRHALFAKGEANTRPHQLIFTATPIPRTLSMTLYAGVNASIIDERPPGRTPITTRVMANSRREDVVDRLLDACDSGAQAYWVCPAIEGDDDRMVSAVQTYEHLSKRLHRHKVGLLHGRMTSQEKHAVMHQFKDGFIQVLVATTVIEVGVDVPNAILMIIENAERFGLTQIHQLRGRVGRGDKASACILLYEPPLGAAGKQRLTVLRDSMDGFYIAEQDLAMRGPGDMLGREQSGEVLFKIADLTRDADLLPKAHAQAQALLGGSPLRQQALLNRWLKFPPMKMQA